MRGRQLKIAKAWLKEQGNQLSFALLAKEFIQASQKILLMVFLQNTGKNWDKAFYSDELRKKLGLK